MIPVLLVVVVPLVPDAPDVVVVAPAAAELEAVVADVVVAPPLVVVDDVVEVPDAAGLAPSFEPRVSPPVAGLPRLRVGFDAAVVELCPDAAPALSAAPASPPLFASAPSAFDSPDGEAAVVAGFAPPPIGVLNSDDVFDSVPAPVGELAAVAPAGLLNTPAPKLGLGKPPKVGLLGVVVAALALAPAAAAEVPVDAADDPNERAGGCCC